MTVGVDGNLLLRGYLLLTFHLKDNLRHGMKFNSSFVFYYIIIRNPSSTSSSIPCSVPVRILGDETHNKINIPVTIKSLYTKEINVHTSKKHVNHYSSILSIILNFYWLKQLEAINSLVNMLLSILWLNRLP